VETEKDFTKIKSNLFKLYIKDGFNNECGSTRVCDKCYRKARKVIATGISIQSLFRAILLPPEQPVAPTQQVELSEDLSESEESEESEELEVVEKITSKTTDCY
jgi:hypothetical protein